MVWRLFGQAKPLQAALKFDPDQMDLICENVFVICKLVSNISLC